MHSDRIRTFTRAKVVAEGQTYPDAKVEQFPHWTRIHTSREQPETEPEVWVPNVRIKEVHPNDGY